MLKRIKANWVLIAGLGSFVFFIFLMGIWIFGRYNFAKIVTGSFWPLVTIFFFIYFRKEVSALINRTESVETPLGKFLAKYDEAVNKGNISASSDLPSTSSCVNNDEVPEKLDDDPFRTPHQESDKDFLKRIEGKDVSDLDEDEIDRYYSLVKPDENFSSFKYRNFIYQPGALAPISMSARSFLADGDFLELSLGKRTVSVGCVFVAWQKVEFIVSHLNREKGGNELVPSSGGPDPKPRRAISFEDKLQYLIYNNFISPSLVRKISSANEAQHAITQYKVGEIETDRARKFVDLVISIINQVENEHGSI